MSKREISPVETRKDKERTYIYHLERYKKAMQNGFYYESIIIVYSMIEDRLRSFLYHTGCLASEKSYKIDSEKTKSDIKKIVSTYKESNENDQLGITSITGKAKIVSCIIKFSIDESENMGNNLYLTTLKERLCKRVNPKEVLETLEELKMWCKYRNEIIHALMNKNIESLQEKLESKVKQGMTIARKIDSFVAKIKRQDVIRKAANLKIEKQKL